MSFSQTFALALLVAGLACSKTIAQGAPEGGSSAVATTVDSSDGAELRCMPAAQSQQLAKPRVNAEAPYADCAKGIFSHCGAEGSYCSIALNIEMTRRTRTLDPIGCCYGRDRPSP